HPQQDRSLGRVGEEIVLRRIVALDERACRIGEPLGGGRGGHEDGEQEAGRESALPHQGDGRVIGDRGGCANSNASRTAAGSRPAVGGGARLQRNSRSFGMEAWSSWRWATSPRRA